jgi:hypothetical protein
MGGNFNLIIFILTTVVILAGLGIVIYGMIKKNVKLIALGVFVALLPSLVDFFSSRLL